MKNKFKNKKSNNSSFIFLIFEISKVRNIGRCPFGCCKFCTLITHSHRTLIKKIFPILQFRKSSNFHY